MSNRLGVCIIGSNGAVATTVMAGVALMRKGAAPRHGMITETEIKERLGLAPTDNFVFGGWDLRGDDAYTAALSHGVLQKHQLDEVKEELQAIKPWPAVASEKFLKSWAGKHCVPAKNHREEIAILEENLKQFKSKNDLQRVVMVNLTSTEKFIAMQDCHLTIEAFEAALDKNDERISPAMKYLYVAVKNGIPHANFTPSLCNIPALDKLAQKNHVPLAGDDGKTGQTLVKTVLAPMFNARQLFVQGWYSTNILGNNDGLVLNDPESNKTKITSKQAVLDDILGYKVPDHQVHIHYYKPRGDAKEAWDNIDLVGFLGQEMQLKVNFLCKDSILAAPIVVDLVRLLDCAKKNNEAGIQRQFSMFFKAPAHLPDEKPIHDLFKQRELLDDWVDKVAPRRLAAVG